MQPRPKKSLGQHFLTNPEICRRIAALLDMQETDKVIEIGPGPGALTRELLALPHARLLVLEKDEWWAGERGADAEVWQGDALLYPWADLEPGYKIIGNLPYNVASPLIWDICSQARFGRAVFMTQLEVAERICALPGSRQYGSLSVWVQCHCRPSLELRLAPGAFSPPPKVHSGVVSFDPAGRRVAWPDQLKRVLKVSFQQRRKQISGIFRREMPILLGALEQLGIDGGMRPENLSCRNYLDFAEILAKSG